ncbi:gibberellin 2-beta-dioxygenase-like [Andrographis paniculata]|uniref:gibberellin 2-beta-dioxygenase-like n=1 Tax=Andrographis paniculata TaxID=175694 RepID=UPI0021E93111|nr:gibberellin 2-beta-dioxygenase-like [Andrographis paniculata]
MVVLSQQPIPDTLSGFRTTCKTAVLTQIPVVDLSDGANAARLIVEACRDFGFFKVVNHRVSPELLAELEAEAVKFFKQPPPEKEKSGPPNPFGYGNKRIGVNGDVGWIEYLLFCINHELTAQSPHAAAVPCISHTLRRLVNRYTAATRDLAGEVLEMAAEGLGIKDRGAMSRLVRSQTSDSCFRINHYPPCPEAAPPPMSGVVGFGEHTDPQLVSVLRSNAVSGLQICLKDGTWLPVPPDHASFFFLVGDSLQVMSNGRFRSVKHRVVAGGQKSRLSMIYFAGAPLSAKIEPLASLMGEGEESLYKEFTWSEYKKSAYKSRLGAHRLGLFEKKSINLQP